MHFELKLEHRILVKPIYFLKKKNYYGKSQDWLLTHLFFPFLLSTCAVLRQLKLLLSLMDLGNENKSENVLSCLACLSAQIEN